MLSSITIKVRQFFLYKKKNIFFIKTILFLYHILDSLFQFKVSAKLEFMVSHKYKIIFVLNPKVASRSLIDSFSKIDDFQVYEAKIEKIDKKFKSYNWYAVLRDPISRTYSCYMQKIVTNDPIIHARIWKSYRGAINKNMTFIDFVNFLNSNKGNDENADRHWKSQSTLLNRNSNLPIDKQYKKIFLLEDIDNIPLHFKNYYGFDIPVFKKLLKTEKDKIYSDKFIHNIIIQRYAKDIELYNLIKRENL